VYSPNSEKVESWSRNKLNSVKKCEKTANHYSEICSVTPVLKDILHSDNTFFTMFGNGLKIASDQTCSRSLWSVTAPLEVSFNI